MKDVWRRVVGFVVMVVFEVLWFFQRLWGRIKEFAIRVWRWVLWAISGPLGY